MLGNGFLGLGLGKCDGTYYSFHLPLAAHYLLLAGPIQVSTFSWPALMAALNTFNPASRCSNVWPSSLIQQQSYF
jgi:hypothetical protein